jgi:hypothetical protein
MGIEFLEMQRSFEWTVYRGENFTVTVRAWGEPRGFKWNVYASFFEGHPFFGDFEKSYGLTFHGGVTLERKITTEPREVSYYSNQYTCFKVEWDYQHYMDDFENDNPNDGIPPAVLYDARELAEELFEIENEE